MESTMEQPNRTDTIISLFKINPNDYVQLELHKKILNGIKTDQLINFYIFMQSLKTSYDNKEQALINAIKEFKIIEIRKSIKNGFRFEDITTLKNFLLECFKGKLVGSAIYPFSLTEIYLNDRGEFINRNTNKIINTEDELEFLNSLLKQQHLIGVPRQQELINNINESNKNEHEYFKAIEEQKVEYNREDFDRAFMTILQKIKTTDTLFIKVKN